MALCKYKNMKAKYNLSKKSRTKKDIKYIVVHYTGTDASAMNNIKYFKSGDRGASADFFIDDKGIYKFNPNIKRYYSWHCGDGHGEYEITNANSIGVEVVSSGKAYTEKEIIHLRKLITWLQKKYGEFKIVRHWDASRKRCPYYYCGSTAADNRWKKLLTKIS
jgi:N-acetylmuramoyl-L-alanine amidase CwlA